MTGENISLLITTKMTCTKYYSHDYLYGQVGLEAFERGMWSRPESRYGMSNYLVNYALSRGQKEGADVAGDVATALVIGAEIFKENGISFFHFQGPITDICSHITFTI
jgi:hypothetical protein